MRSPWQLYRGPLVFVSVLVLGAVLAIRQTLNHELGHLRMREDFILLEQRDERREAAACYQRLMSNLPTLSDRALLEDFQRTVLLVDPDVPDTDNLVWKYHWAVRKELEQRTQKRVSESVQPRGQGR